MSEEPPHPGEQGTEPDPETPKPEMTAWYRDGRKRLGVALVALTALAAIGLVLWNELKRPADVHNPDVTFTHEQPTKPHDKSRAAANWPTFRLNRQRTGYLPTTRVHPPFKRLWRYGNKPLLEFPPIAVKGVLYFVDNDGTARALRAKDGRRVWKRRIGRLNAATPTYARGRLYLVNMRPGQVMSLDASSGKTIWRKGLPCRSESSPVVAHRTVYFGCENGVLYALRAKDGKEVWSTTLGGAIKGAPAYSGGTLFVGDYGGTMSAVRAKTGEIRWQTGSLGPGLGRAGSFYSTPAVAWGRVYAGNNDNRVYSFDAKTGALAWTYSTGGWVYSGPSAAKVPGTPPTVYIGSYDGNLYALDAKSGQARWSFSMNGRVVGSVSVIGRLVYAATFDGTTTYGVDAKTGKKRFQFHTGAYMPAISDGRLLYLIGYSSLHALKPVGRRKPKQTTKSAKKQAKAAKHRKHQAKRKRSG